MSESTSLDVDLESLLTRVIPCSGTKHAVDASIHGDPDRPAEFLIKAGCPRCDDYRYRPVCRYFVFGFAFNPNQPVYCNKCEYKGLAPEFFLDTRTL